MKYKVQIHTFIYISDIIGTLFWIEVCCVIINYHHSSSSSYYETSHILMKGIDLETVADFAIVNFDEQSYIHSLTENVFYIFQTLASGT